MSSPTVGELAQAYRGRRVLVTGHTGFKGAWLSLWLSELGADVVGFALPATTPSFYSDVAIADRCRHVEGDVRDPEAVRRVLHTSNAEIVFHLAAQSLVRHSYADPLGTFATNALGTANVLEAIRRDASPRAVVVVTSDKCYDPDIVSDGHRESDPLGGHDLYSASKGASELVAASYRRSFFPPERLDEHAIAIATARAGNSFGGGDWAPDRIVPDAIRALAADVPVPVRNPGAVRPWQHVLEPLGGYLLLGARLLGIGDPDRRKYCAPWNFGPPTGELRTVVDLVEELIKAWGSGSWSAADEVGAPAESFVLRLNTDKARDVLGWRSRWDFARTCVQTVSWYRARHDGASDEVLRALSLRQIAEYLASEQVLRAP